MPDTQLLKTVAARGAPSPERKPLQRFDWLQRALDLFVAEGIDAVRITRLADDLGVTRGSFYWHFENRDDLIAALVSYWRQKSTAAIVESVRHAQSLEQGIFALFETCIDTAQFNPGLDLAIREWSRRSPEIRDLVDREDAARIDVLRDFFAGFGFAPTDALIRARVLYFAQIGFYALETSEPLETRLGYTDTYFECFTGRKPDPAAAEQFLRHVRKTHGDQLA